MKKRASSREHDRPPSGLAQRVLKKKATPDGVACDSVFRLTFQCCTNCGSLRTLRQRSN